MIGYLEILLRLTVWFLLTADLSGVNIFIGVCVAFLLPHRPVKSFVLSDWLHVIFEIIIAIPRAYWEAFELIFFPHLEEEIILERVKPNRTPGLIFLDIFLITFTPKSIVLRYCEDGWYEVHNVRRRRTQ